MILNSLFTIAATSVSLGTCTGTRDNIVNDPVSNVICLLEPLQNLMFSLRNVTIALGLLFILVGAITLATNQGNPEKITKGKQTITWAIAAIVLAIVFWSLVAILAQIAGTTYIDPSGKISVPSPTNLFPTL